MFARPSARPTIKSFFTPIYYDKTLNNTAVPSDTPMYSTSSDSKPRAILRRNGEAKWPHGVASGGTVTDMLEYLSLTKVTNDYGIVLWLQAHYVESFGRIERLDGLVVNDEPNRVNLEHAYERYLAVQGGFTRDQKLWVPGLEPINPVRRHGSRVTIPETPLNIEYKDWRASEAFSKNGHEVERKAKFESSWTDANRWSRTIWSAPSVKTVVKNADLARQSFQPSWTMQAAPTNKVAKVDELGSDDVAKIDHKPPRRLSTPATTSSHTLSPVESASSNTLSRDTLEGELTLDDIVDPDLKRKAGMLRAIFPDLSVQHRFDALLSNNGHWNDTCDMLAREEDDAETLHLDEVSKGKTAQRIRKGPNSGSPRAPNPDSKRRTRSSGQGNI